MELAPSMEAVVFDSDWVFCSLVEGAVVVVAVVVAVVAAVVAAIVSGVAPSLSFLSLLSYRTKPCFVLLYLLFDESNHSLSPIYSPCLD